MPIKVSDLKDQLGTRGPRPRLYCAICGTLWSAHRGDYFAADPDIVIKHCGEPMRLVTKHVEYREVAS